MASRFAHWSSRLLLLLGASCAEQSIAVSPEAQGVRIATTDPPPGAEDLGPIEGKDSEDCDIVSAKGTREGATAALKQAALRRGIDFVKIVTVREPYSDHDCYHKAYLLRGIGYRTKHEPPAPPPSSPPALVASAAPVVAPPPANCEPPCATGFVCQAGVCAAACEPACIAPQICRADRVCVAPAP